MLRKNSVFLQTEALFSMMLLIAERLESLSLDTYAPY
jgi:hypothetical protein